MYILFIDMGFKTMSNSEKKKKTREKTMNKYEKKREKSTEWMYKSTYQLVVCVITVADFSRTK